ncbi:MAG TPA: hypothetical protein VF432_04365 [Thermoanaerobaculia bacterium]
MRWAFGLALYAHTCFFLGLLGLLRPWPVLAVTAVFAVAALRLNVARPRVAWLAAVPPFVLALYPAIAFDETLYHLPFVQAFARDGALRFHPDLRFPVFPVLHEVLCVPPFLLGGDVATHLVALLELVLIVALLMDWDARAGWLAAALFVGSPLVVQLATTLHVELALTLFVVAGLRALALERYALAGFFLGSACSVKYLGIYFAAAALVMLLAGAGWQPADRPASRRRAAGLFALTCALTALPMTAWIFFHTHDPLFPFLRPSLWSLDAPAPVLWTDRVLLLWNVTFGRDRVGMQPPVTPFLVPLVIVLIVAAVKRDALARVVLWMSAVYVVVFNFLPQDVRYLVPLLPLLCIVAASFLAARWPKLVPVLAILAIAPGIAYAGYRIARQGPPPVIDDGKREAWLAEHIPEYRALRLAGTARVYACRGERLKAHAAGQLLGDHNGPWSYERILTGAVDTRTLAERMRAIGARYYLVVKAACPPPVPNGGLTLVHEDAATQLWRAPR